jgi:CHAT domain-containing protein
MPGFQADGGNGLKGQLEGRDLFLTTCGLMAAGADEILVSRWNTGGDTNLRVGREYLKERENETPANALRAARDWMRTQEVTETSEPKLSLERGTDKLKADHPVFWASELVVEVPAQKQGAK